MFLEELQMRAVRDAEGALLYYVVGPIAAPVALPEGCTIDEPIAAPALTTEQQAAADAQRTLAELDVLLPRVVEDVIEALGVNEASLPAVVQARLAAKRAARAVVSA